VSAIATCRRKQFGGHFTGSLNSELEILLKAAEAGCPIVDLEVESAEEAKAGRNWPSSAPAFRAAGAVFADQLPRLYRAPRA
jgi:3-dehydroquinate dehydratase